MMLTIVIARSAIVIVRSAIVVVRSAIVIARSGATKQSPASEGRDEGVAASLRLQ
jgi:hypothetical protein